MASNSNQNGSTNGPLSNGGPDLPPVFSITPQIQQIAQTLPAANIMINATSDNSQTLPVQPPLSDFLGQVIIAG